MLLSGSSVALVTPMNLDGSLDKKALNDLIEWHIAEKTAGIVIAGTTGEIATLSPEEHLELITHAVKQAKGRIPIIAGTGTNNTTTTLALSKNAQRAKADACLIVTPYYNKPTQQGLYAHYKTIADHLDLPIILYNVPGRTACDLLPETVARLAEIPSIMGIKEATGNLERMLAIQKLCSSTFTIYSGDDASALSLLQHGAGGVISVTANVAPAKMAEFCKAALTGDDALAKTYETGLMPVHHILFIESNPIPTKWVLCMMGKIQMGIRLPLLPLDSKYHDQVKTAMQNAGIL